MIPAAKHRRDEPNGSDWVWVLQPGAADGQAGHRTVTVTITESVLVRDDELSVTVASDGLVEVRYVCRYGGWKACGYRISIAP